MGTGRQLSPERQDQLSYSNIQKGGGSFIAGPAKGGAGSAQLSDFHMCGSYDPLSCANADRGLTFAAVGPQTQTRPSAAVRANITMAAVAAQVIQISTAPVAT